MVMHGHTDLLEALIGSKGCDVLTPDGEINYFLPPERDQQLESDDLLDIINANDEPTIITNMDMLNDVNCQALDVAETVEIQPEITYTSTAMPTTSQIPESQNNQIIFQFPEPSTDEFSTIDLCFLTEVSDVNDVTFMDGVMESEQIFTEVTQTPSSPTSSCLSTLPPTPDTASSLDSSSSNVPSFIKEELKLAIRSKRMREGKGDIEVKFVPPPPEELTKEEEMKRVEKRQKNKLAAQKCREKKRIIADRLEAETKDLMKRQNKYKLEIQKLLDEREQLMEIVNIHKAVCPKFRAKSSNF